MNVGKFGENEQSARAHLPRGKLLLTATFHQNKKQMGWFGEHPILLSDLYLLCAPVLPRSCLGLRAVKCPEQPRDAIQAMNVVIQQQNLRLLLKD